MAGTDRTKQPILGGPVIVLVEPQLGENIGTAARAMLNFGLTDLRLVRPRDGWPNDAAVAAAAGADQVLDGARVCLTVADAIGDLHHVYAATARRRDVLKTVITPEQAADAMRRASAAGEGIGVLFGPERAGLNNDDLSLADTILSVPLNPAYGSLNLAQAVLLVAYEWFRAGNDGSGQRPGGGGRPSRRASGISSVSSSISSASWMKAAFSARRRSAPRWCTTSAPYSSVPA